MSSEPGSSRATGLTASGIGVWRGNQVRVPARRPPRRIKIVALRTIAIAGKYIDLANAARLFDCYGQHELFRLFEASAVSSNECESGS